ncbi:MAG: hypothetical protein K2O56_06600 [Muribaculaceae bacterium]|nr:hypothetical protein [Muribaculaceae bacterium]
MTAFQILIKAAGLRTLWLGIASVVAGTAAAAAHGNLQPFPALACLLFAIFAQCASNVSHRYYYVKNGFVGNGEKNIMRADDIDRPVEYILKEGIQVFAILTATAGLAVLSMAGWWTLAVAALIAVVAFMNSIGLHPLSRSVYYPVATFLIFGPIAVVGTALVQSQHDAPDILCWWDLAPAVTMGMITGLMAVNSHVILGAMYYSQDALSSRTTFFGRYGKGATVTLLAVSTAVYGVIGILAPFWMNIDDGFVYMPVPLLSMALSFVMIWLLRKPGYCKTAWRLSLVNIVLFAVISLIIFYFIGYPEGYNDESLLIN